MTLEVQDILNDIYALDPSLRSREEEILKIINQLISSKPEAEFDAAFKEELRAELLAKMAVRPHPVWYNFMMNKKFALYAGVAVLVIAIVPAMYFMGWLGAPAVKLAFEQKITSTGSNAFGALTFNVQSGGERGSLAAPMVATDSASQNVAYESAVAPAPAVGLGGAGTISYRAGGVGGGGAAVAGVPSKMIAYPGEFTDYVYKYAGEPITLSDDEVAVLKRQVSGELARKIGGLFSRANLGIVNLGAFQSPQVQNMALNDGEYEIALGVKEENISIYRSYIGGPEIAVRCAPGMRCPDANKPLTAADIPADEELISIANAFLAKYGISRKGYGAPEVDHTQQILYAYAAAGRVSVSNGVVTTEEFRAPDQTPESAYIPTQLDVKYPLLLNGEPAYDESGQKAALTVSVSLYTKSVQNVYNIATQNYVSSNYAAVKDADAVLKVAENGGFGNYHPADATKKVTLELDTPVKAYVRQWRYTTGQSEELFVPSLIFKVKEAPTDAGYYYPRVIVIPLVKDLFDEKNNPDNGGGIEPMPLRGTVTPPAAIEPSKVDIAPVK